MEVHIGGTEVRVNKLEELCQQLQCASQDIPNNIKNEVEFQMRHLHQERQEADSLMADKRCLTAAIGNLQDLESLSHAQSWLTDAYVFVTDSFSMVVSIEILQYTLTFLLRASKKGSEFLET